VVASDSGEEFTEESKEAGVFGWRLIDPPLFGRHPAEVEGVVGFMAKILDVPRVIEI
jgi:hypothetical protein